MSENESLKLQNSSKCPHFVLHSIWQNRVTMKIFHIILKKEKRWEKTNNTINWKRINYRTTHTCHQCNYLNYCLLLSYFSSQKIYVCYVFLIDRNFRCYSWIKFVRHLLFVDLFVDDMYVNEWRQKCGFMKKTNWS